MLKNNRKLFAAFTLIELLVVISVIAILISMVTVSFTSAQKQARDTKRKSDLVQYRTLLESYANKTNGLFPAHASVVTADTICGASELNQANCPTDPKNGTSPYGYKYVSDGTAGFTATKYTIYGILESATTTYWVVCSNGSTISKTTGVPSMSDCP